MKVRRINIEPNTDGTFQVEVCADYGLDCDSYSASASSLQDCISKIEEGMKKIEGTKKKKNKKSVAAFVGKDENDD